MARCGWGASIALGWFVGLATVMFWGYGAIGLRGTELIRPLAIVLLSIGLLAMFTHHRMRHGGMTLEPTPPPIPWTGLECTLLVVLLLSMAVKISAEASSILWNPGRCEDALAYWLYKAKTVTMLGHIPFSPDHPFYLGGSNPRYPIYPSMIAAWIPLVNREWNETQSVIPWLIAILMLPAAAGCLLPNGTARLPRIIAAYLVSSLPLAAIHVFRPGYVDLILASFLLCAVGLTLQWREDVRPGVIVLAIVFFVAAACTKREGVMAVAAVWGVVILFELLPRFPGKVTWRRTGAMLIAASLIGVAVYTLMDLSDLSGDAGRWAYHPEAWPAIWRHAMEWSTFSLFFPLAIMVAGGLVFFRRGTNAWLAVSLCAALFAYAVSPFLLTDNVRFALNDQTPSRLLLHVAPAMVVALAHGTKRGIAWKAPTN